MPRLLRITTVLFAIAVVCAVALSLTLAGCQEKGEIKIGAVLCYR